MIAALVKLIGMAIVVEEVVLTSSPTPALAALGIGCMMMGQLAINLRGTSSKFEPTEVDRMLENCTEGTYTDWDKFDIQADYQVGLRNRW